MTDNNRIPADDQPTVPLTESPASDAAAPAAPVAPAAPAAPVDGVATDAAAPAKPKRRRALIAGGAVLGAVLLAGGGVAIGAAVADDDDDDDRDDRASSVVDGTTGDRASNDRDGAGSASGDRDAVPADLGAASADELEDILQAAAGAADGEPVSAEANRDGSWDVQLRAADGSETDVRVAPGGAAEVRGTEAPDADDTAPQNVLDATTLRTIVDAALADPALGGTGGRVIDIDADDSGASPFDISVLTGDSRIIEITLDASGTVTRSEVDD